MQNSLKKNKSLISKNECLDEIIEKNEINNEFSEVIKYKQIDEINSNPSKFSIEFQEKNENKIEKIIKKSSNEENIINDKNEVKLKFISLEH